ncbi:hypothetical protein MIND_00578600 [Mycena indigotica]|uniref:DUF6534 domain-containing protein n=1 Tax=Mycena indigotica TaxID=2126181 RepID=A0A8H6W5E5_9AGAR|nr:uncharacterized protein MIND_00578600 [Mycena indigotica]KAF7303496.1 hypothetical protein MIND_00578600 [Mycena indigotica]
MDSQSQGGGFKPSFNIGELTIPLFVGTIMNWALMGALVVQAYIYFVAFPRDRLPNKAIVCFVLVAELLQTLGDSRDTIRTFGAKWGDFASLDTVGWAWFSVPILGSTIGCVGQLFFAWRIHIIGARKAWVVPIIITIITLFQFGAGIWTGVQIIQAKHFSALTFDRMKPPIAWLSATAAADLLIVVATIYYLLKAREPGFSGATQAAVTRIITVTIETGIPCAVFALVDLALFVKYNGNNFHLGTCIWLSKVYSISILTILNSRAHIGHHDTQLGSANVTLSSRRGSRPGQSHPSKNTATASTIQFASRDGDFGRDTDKSCDPVFSIGKERGEDLEMETPRFVV